MESVEDEERQRDPGDNSPGEQAEELSLNTLRDVPVSHEGVEDPEGDVGEQHEGDDLPARLGLLLGPGGADPPAGLADDHAWVGGGRDISSVFSQDSGTVDLTLERDLDEEQ